MSSIGIATLFDKMEAKTEEEYYSDYNSGTTTLNELKKDFTDYKKQMYNCIKNLIEGPDRDALSMNKSRDELFNRIIPQLKFIDELTAVIHSYPHRALPTTTEFLNALVENTKLAIDNVQSVGIVGPVYTSKNPVLLETIDKKQTVPYTVLQGGDSDNDDSGSDIDKDVDNDDIHKKTSNSKKSTKKDEIYSNSSESESDELKFVQNPGNNDDASSISVSDEEPLPKPSKSSKALKTSKTSKDLKEQKKKSKSKLDESNSASTSSTESSVSNNDQDGGKKTKKNKKRVKRSTKLNNQANTRTL